MRSIAILALMVVLLAGACEQMGPAPGPSTPHTLENDTGSGGGGGGGY